MPREDEKMRHTLTKAITAAINQMGMPAFKKTSFFMSSTKES